jgi:hypothetical protein
VLVAECFYLWKFRVMKVMAYDCFEPFKQKKDLLCFDV